MAAVGERRITYDARGLAEPHADAPRTATIEDGRATFDARDLTTRQINLELRRLLYEEGILDVTVQNPGAKHSIGVGILTRCKLRFEGSLGYFGLGLIDGPEITVTGRVGWSACENMMSGVVVVESNAGSLTGAAMRGGDLVIKGRVGARTGIDQKGGTIIIARRRRLDDGLHAPARPPDHLRRRRSGPRRLDVRRDDLRRRQGEVARHRLRARRVDGRRHRAVERKFSIYGLGSPPEFQKFVCGKKLYNYDNLEPVGEEARPMTTSDRYDQLGGNVGEGQPANRTRLGRSPIFTPEVLNDIHMKAELGRYRMRGFSMFKKIPHWDDLMFLPGTLTRFVIEGYREKCETKTVLGSRFAKKPIELDIPIYITGMSFGALSLEAKMALAKGASMAGTATCSGEGGMIPPERDLSTKWYYQLIQSRYGFNPHHLMLADACEFFIGQGCKVGLGGHLMGQKVTEQVAEMRSLPPGIDQRSPARHPDWLGPDDLLAQGAGDPRGDRLPDSDPAQARRRARLRRRAHGRQVRAGHHLPRRRRGRHRRRARTSPPRRPGIPLMAAIPEARRALEDVGLADEIQLVVAGGIRNGADVAKCLALGADAVAIGHAALVALNCNKEIPGVTDYEGTIGVPAGECYHCHTGRCPVGITTQDPELRKRLIVDEAAERVYNFLHTMTLELQMLARACGKTNVHSLEPEDLCALTTEAAAMAKVPLAGTDWIPGVSEERTLARMERMLERHLDNPVDYLPEPERAARGALMAEERFIALDAERLAGKRFPYQEDVSLVEDIDLLAATPGDDINWLEDVSSSRRTASRRCSTATRTRS